MHELAAALEKLLRIMDELRRARSGRAERHESRGGADSSPGRAVGEMFINSCTGGPPHQANIRHKATAGARTFCV